MYVVNFILLLPMLWHRGHLAKLIAQYDAQVKPKLEPLLMQARGAVEKVSAILDQKRK